MAGLVTETNTFHSLLVNDGGRFCLADVYERRWQECKSTADSRKQKAQIVFCMQTELSVFLPDRLLKKRSIQG